MSGCAGSKSKIRADSSNFPVSFSPAIRNYDGNILMEDEWKKVGSFNFKYKTMHMFWKIIPLSKTNYDISNEINKQVVDSGGEGVVNLNITNSQNWWTAFNSILSLGLLPTYNNIEITGDIVKRKDNLQ